MTGSNTAAGPLVVAAANPRYFTIRSGNGDDRRAIYLTGSHIWNNLHDGLGPGPGASCAEVPERNDYDAYLDFLVDHGHNFIRLWRWEHFKSQAAGGAFHGRRRLCGPVVPRRPPRDGGGGKLTVSSPAAISFTAPFGAAGPAVLCLKKQDGPGPEPGDAR